MNPRRDEVVQPDSDTAWDTGGARDPVGRDVAGSKQARESPAMD